MSTPSKRLKLTKNYNNNKMNNRGQLALQAYIEH